MLQLINIVPEFCAEIVECEEKYVPVPFSKMPFIGQDWRSPGEHWVKTDAGWERLKLLSILSYSSEHIDILNDNDGEQEIHFNNKLSITNDNSNYRHPHVFINASGSRESSYSTTLNEALQLLDFKNAVKDLTRFYYVCKVLYYLITEKMSSLSGSAQKSLFTTIQAVLNQVVHSQQNTGTLKVLMSELSNAMKECLIGRHIGCSELWRSHDQQLHRWNHMITMQNIFHEFKERLPEDEENKENPTKLSDLPVDCLRLILLRLSNHQDILNAGKALDREKDHEVTNEVHLWRELCMFHFTSEQINAIQLKQKDPNDWRGIYHRLRRYHGQKEVYAQMLHMCSHCRCLFWKSIGHPCLSDQQTANSIPVTPTAFLELFDV